MMPRFVSALEAYRQAVIDSGQRCFAFSASDGVVDDPQRAFELALLDACRALPGGLPDDVLIIITDMQGAPTPNPLTCPKWNSTLRTPPDARFKLAGKDRYRPVAVRRFCGKPTLAVEETGRLAHAP